LVLELKEKFPTLEKEYHDNLRASKEEEWSKIATAEAEKSTLEKDLASLRHSYTEKETRNDGMISALEKARSTINP
jgi:hypothetical protein